MPLISSLRKVGSIGALIVGGTLASNAVGQTLTMHATSNPGGYWADPDGALESVLANYAPEAKMSFGQWFWTMCLETDEFFWDGKKYNASITGTSAHNGGTNTDLNDKISVGTAYLYKNFALGYLDNLVAGFTYDAVGGARMQNTIWSLEQEAGKVGDAVLLNHLTSVFGSVAAYSADYAGSEVMVMNLTKFDGAGGDGQAGTLRQDQLVLTSVPDGGSTIGLFGVVLGAFLFARRGLLVRRE